MTRRSSAPIALETGIDGDDAKRRLRVIVTLRLPIALLERIKTAANKRDVPYQSLIKIWLAEKVDAA